MDFYGSKWIQVGRLLIKVLQKNRTNRIIWVCACACIPSLYCVWLFETPWTVTHQTPLSKGFFKQEYWSGLPFPTPVNLPDPGIKPTSPVTLALGGKCFTTEPPIHIIIGYIISRYFVWRILHKGHFILTPTKLCSGIFPSVHKEEESKKNSKAHVTFLQVRIKAIIDDVIYRSLRFLLMWTHGSIFFWISVTEIGVLLPANLLLW